MENKKTSFSGSLGFILAAAGSAVGLGNLWRFPYLAAKDGGGLFILVYIILALTFGFTLLTADIAIGRRTGKNALEAYGAISKKWKFVGVLSFIVPFVILGYYSVIGGWITKYVVDYVVTDASVMAQDGYFTSFISSPVSPIVFMFIFLAITSVIVYLGVEKGIEKFSKIIMPGLLLLIIAIAVFSLTLSYTDENGITRTGLEGMKIYFVPNFEGLTFSKVLEIIVDAVSQLFFSLSVAMGIMITYGSYVKKDINLTKSVTQIEIFDTIVAVLAGLMIVPAIYVFAGLEGMNAGAGLMFISLPKVFNSMGAIGGVVGALFFLMVIFAALTSSVSIMETVVAGVMSLFKTTRKKAAFTMFVIFALIAVVICMGYNVLYFEADLPNGAKAQQLLDVIDYVATSLLMPVITISTAILIGWITKPKWVIEEMESSGHKFTRKYLFSFVIKYCTPVLMVVLLLKALGIL
ncbi:MAG: sodium-dependent transporter [Clostridia bacterium]|nr:sodium-dependent transporter [Clostridia bacterium]